jgi:predicted transposase YdaD
MREGLIQGRLEGRLEGQKEGQLEGERKVVLKLLSRKLGALPTAVMEQLTNLTLADYEKLTLDLLDFQCLEDVTGWLETNSNKDSQNS